MTPKHRILITGANGLLGQKLVSLLRSQEEAIFLATSFGDSRIVDLPRDQYQTMDISNRQQVLDVVSEFNPNVIINTAAYTQVDGCEEEPEKCRALNVDSVGHLVAAAQQSNAKLIHLSTDFVFDGAQGRYKETDEPSPLSIYGQSKLDSEKLIKSSGLEDWVIARTIIIYGVTPGMSRSNLVLWAYNALKSGQEIQVVNDQYRAPTLAEDLAMACWLMVVHDARGIYHISGPETHSILEWVRQVAEYFKLDSSLIHAITSDVLNQKADRPPRTGFDISKAVQFLGYAPRSFSAGLDLIAAQMESEK